ncbi:MAG: 3-phosphoshikimate 1-carboxyvinyltransferase [Acidobacteriota bacterium]
MTDSNSTSPDPTSDAPSTYAVPVGGRLRGPLHVPGSKSVTQRYFDLALIGRAPMTVRRPLLSDDPLLFLDAMRTAGFGVEHIDSAVVLTPPAAAARDDGDGGGEARAIFCGNGGTMFRFLTAALTAVPGRWRLDGVPRLRERPVGPLIDALRRLGATVECLVQEGYAPLRIQGGTLGSGETRLDAGSSSQYLSAMLIAALAAPAPVTIHLEALTSAPYVDLTLDAIADLTETDDGAPAVERLVESGETVGFRVRPARVIGGTITVEGDDSAAAYPAAGALLTGGSVRLHGLRRHTRHGDRALLDLLARCGADVRWSVDGEGDDVVTITGPADGCLRGLTEPVDMSGMPDQVPTVAALAPFLPGTTRIVGAAHLRIKESDRLAAMATELRRTGAEAREHDDGLEIDGTWSDPATAPPPSPVSIETYHDHRIAMAMALVGLRRSGVQIQQPGVVAKSYPDFWQDLEQLLRS